MALLCLLALVAWELLPRVQSARINRGIAREVQSSGYVDDADIPHTMQELLACEVVGEEDKFLIPSKYKPFWDYFYSKLNYLTDRSLKAHTISCKTYTPSNASFKNGVGHCNPCALVGFNLSFLERCSAPRTAKQFADVHEEVLAEGGFCSVRFISAEERTLQTCMVSPKGVSGLSAFDNRSMRLFARCNIQSDRANLEFIEQREENIKEIEETVRRHQEFIKEKQEKIKELQKDIDLHKQDIVYHKQIFEGK